MNATFGITLAQAIQQKGDKPKHVQDVSQSKAVQMLKVFDCDREKFVSWNDKLINAMSRIHGSSRSMLKGLNRRWANRDREFTTEREIQDDFNNTAADEEIVANDLVEFSDLNEDLYYVLVEKQKESQPSRSSRLKQDAV